MSERINLKSRSLFKPYSDSTVNHLVGNYYNVSSLSSAEVIIVPCETESNVWKYIKSKDCFIILTASQEKRLVIKSFI